VYRFSSYYKRDDDRRLFLESGDGIGELLSLLGALCIVFLTRIVRQI
jgi:hypothetical protein